MAEETVFDITTPAAEAFVDRFLEQVNDFVVWVEDQLANVEDLSSLPSNRVDRLIREARAVQAQRDPPFSGISLHVAANIQGANDIIINVASKLHQQREDAARPSRPMPAFVAPSRKRSMNQMASPDPASHTRPAKRMATPASIGCEDANEAVLAMADVFREFGEELSLQDPEDIPEDLPADQDEFGISTDEAADAYEHLSQDKIVPLVEAKHFRDKIRAQRPVEYSAFLDAFDDAGWHRFLRDITCRELAHICKQGKLLDPVALEKLPKVLSSTQEGFYWAKMTQVSDPDFVAGYTGQAVDPRVRKNGHMNDKDNKSKSKGLFHSIWTAKPDRHVVFFHAGWLPAYLRAPKVDIATRNLALNIGEEWHAQRFQTLQPSTLDNWLHPSVARPNRIIGLNVAHPLDQGSPIRALKSVFAMAHSNNGTVRAYITKSLDLGRQTQRANRHIPQMKAQRSSGPNKHVMREPLPWEPQEVEVYCDRCGNRQVDEFPNFHRPTNKYIARRMTCAVKSCGDPDTREGRTKSKKNTTHFPFSRTLPTIANYRISEANKEFWFRDYTPPARKGAWSSMH